MSTPPSPTTLAVHVFRALPPSGAICALDASGTVCEVCLRDGGVIDESLYRAYAMRPLPAVLVGPLQWGGGKLEASALLLLPSTTIAACY